MNEPSSESVKKQDGITSSERYLSRLATRTFLSLWSYPGVYRDQKCSQAGHGKEVCDLLVVFDDHVIIFSDKDCAFPATENLQLDWNRWFRRAVLKSADQVHGAERWIRQHPDRLFLDRQCTKPFPLLVGDVDRLKFHRIVVAHSSVARCRELFGGSGSLLIRSTLQGRDHLAEAAMPFEVGDLDPTKGLVHVLDDTSLDILLAALTTTADFVDYLTRKEALLRGPVSIHAAGEEELLAYYLRNVDERGEHDFILPQGFCHFGISEGIWQDFQDSEARSAQLEADKISYGWDSIVEKFCANAFSGNLIGPIDQDISGHEQAIRWLAKEGRTVRRGLMQALYGLIEKTPNTPGVRGTRVMCPPRPRSPYYVFLVLGTYPSVTEQQYRVFRREVLRALCLTVKLEFPNAEDIVGLATEPKDAPQRSEDVVYLNGRDWDVQIEAEAKELRERLQLLVKVEALPQQTIYEYPTESRSDTD